MLLYSCLTFLSAPQFKEAAYRPNIQLEAPLRKTILQPSASRYWNGCILYQGFICIKNYKWRRGSGWINRYLYLLTTVITQKYKRNAKWVLSSSVGSCYSKRNNLKHKQINLNCFIDRHRYVVKATAHLRFSKNCDFLRCTYEILSTFSRRWFTFVMTDNGYCLLRWVEQQRT